jgi:hypothetical protein
MDLSKLIVPDNLDVGKPLVTCTIEGILEESDLRELALSGLVENSIESEEDPADLKRIKEKHHSVARMMAGGLSQRMVAQLCGYSESYLSILLNNPAMQELVQLYRIQQGAGAAVITEKLRTVGLKALEALDIAIEAGNLNKNELIQTAKLGLDRAGHGPQSKQHIVREDHLFDHTELERRNSEARARSASRIVPSSEVRAALAPPQEKEDEADRPLGEEGPQLSEDRQQ